MANLIFGCGYLGRRVARLWTAAGEQVFAVTRSPLRAAEFAAEGLQPVIADITAADATAIPTEVRTVLFAVGYNRGSPRTIHDVYAQGLRHALEMLPSSVERVIYISSTGVYGPASRGDWVNEDSPCQPTREGGKASLAAEQVLREHRLGKRGVVLRLAGIYGPGRIPRAGDLQAGKPIDAPAEGWLNLIHVDDAAQIVLRAEATASLPNLFVVSDGHPVVRGDYYRELASLLGAPPPQFVTPDPTSPAAQRARSDKRVDNRRLLDQLRPTFQYPSYREGLRAIVSLPPIGK
jgi:nucleoside-diphosphate-sugar epimerase